MRSTARKPIWEDSKEKSPKPTKNLTIKVAGKESEQETGNKLFQSAEKYHNDLNQGRANHIGKFHAGDTEDNSMIKWNPDLNQTKFVEKSWNLIANPKINLQDGVFSQNAVPEY